MCVCVASTKRVASSRCSAIDGDATIAPARPVLDPAAALLADAPASTLAEDAALGAGVAATVTTAGGEERSTDERPASSDATNTPTPTSPIASASSQTPRSDGGAGTFGSGCPAVGSSVGIGSER